MYILRCKVIYFLIIIAGIVATSCEPMSVALSFRQPKKNMALGESDGYFTGMQEVMRRKRVVNILINHGMGTAKPMDYADKELIPRIATSLGFVGDAPDTLRVWDGVTSFKITEYRKNRSILRFFSVHWSNLSRPAKSFLTYNDDIVRGNSLSDPIDANQLLKRYVVNEGFADMMFYANPAGREMLQQPVRQALNLMVLREPLAFLRSKKEQIEKSDLIDEFEIENYENVVIAKSLGSKVVLDVIAEQLQEEEWPLTTQRFTQTGGRFFIFANQLPLLNLMDYAFTDQLGTDQQRISYFNNDSIYNNVRAFSKHMVRDVEIVAFRDPDDLFSYSLPKSLLTYRGKVINVAVSNTERRMSAKLTIDDIKKRVVATDPYTAHENYINNPLLLDLLMNGCGPRDIENGIVQISNPEELRRTKNPAAQSPKMSDLFFMR